MHIVPANTLSRLIIDDDKDWNAKDISNVDQITASLVEAPLASENTYIVAASDSINTEHADLVCDGTDDQVEINYAITNLPTGGGTVILLEGKYYINGQITVNKDNVRLVGQGTSTLFIVTASAIQDIILIDNYDNIVIGLLKIDNSANIHADRHVIMTRNATYVIVDSVYVIGSTDFTGSEVGIGFDTDVSHCSVINCYIIGCRDYCIDLNDAEYCVIKGNHCIGYHHGIGLDAATKACSYNTITGNTIYTIHHDTSAPHGITLTNSGAFDCTHNTVTGNTCVGDNYNSLYCDGIELSGHQTDHNVIVGNTIKNYNHGILIAGHAQYNTITGNTIDGCNTSGIHETGGSVEYCTVIGNVITNAGGDGMTIGLYHSTCIGNRVHGCGGWGINNGASGDNAIIVGNQLEGNTSGGLNNAGAGCQVANNLP